jgi:serine/threonine protein kinase
MRCIEPRPAAKNATGRFGDRNEARAPLRFVECVSSTMVGLEAAENLPSESGADGASGTEASPVEAGAASEPEFPKSGLVLEGKYRLSYRLAFGNMSSVWFAEHLVLAAPVAIKFLRSGADSDVDVRRRFLREARIASAVRSPHVVQVLDYGMERGVPFIVMEFLRGESLARRLLRRGRLPPEETAEILAPLAHALRRAHELGVVHRDLKPDNIFIATDGEREMTKLLDFGVAKVRERGFGVSVLRDTAEGEIVGTPHYMSPEQARGARNVDHRTDVWALGVIAFECLLGFPPFIADGLAGLVVAICARSAPVPSALGPVPAGFDAWFARACNRAPEARFSSLQEAARQLRRVCAEPTPRWPARSTRADSGSSRSGSERSSAPRSRLRWLAALALVSLLGGATAGAARRSSQASRPATSSQTPASAAPMQRTPGFAVTDPRAPTAAGAEQRKSDP